MLGGHMHAEVRQTGLDERGASFFCPSLGACLLHCTTVQFSPYLPQQIPHSILAPSSTREHVHDSHIIFFKQPVVAHPCTCYVFTSGHFQITSTWEADGVGCGKSSHLSISWFFSCFFVFFKPWICLGTPGIFVLGNKAFLGVFVTKWIFCFVELWMFCCHIVKPCLTKH